MLLLLQAVNVTVLANFHCKEEVGEQKTAFPWASVLLIRAVV